MTTSSPPTRPKWLQALLWGLLAIFAALFLREAAKLFSALHLR